MSGKLIVIEGARGSGKSTALRAAHLRLGSLLSTPVVATGEPTYDTVPGGIIRRLLTGESLPLDDPRALQLLFAADRLEHAARVLRPALREGAVVLCDRYVLSSVAHGSDETTWRWIRDLNRLAPEAHLTIVLYLPKEEATRRVLARDGRLDALAPHAPHPHWFYHPEGFGQDEADMRQAAHSRRVAWVDATQPPDDVARAVLREILAELGLSSTATGVAQVGA